MHLRYYVRHNTPQGSRKSRTQVQIAIKNNLASAADRDLNDLPIQPLRTGNRSVATVISYLLRIVRFMQ
jgi:hypothetical protein